MSDRLSFVPLSRKGSEYRWWENPDRPCKGDDRYTELLGVSKTERKEMKTACASCPVYYECLDDLRTVPRYQRYGIQACVQGLT